ncbi:hypothetical protein ACIBKY_51790 [Nonomuraea sp. NPDC050394]|uniref:hypothetical protein n=1 Tax=Nonomuraea sp. NPDC050394 TaxID=3364363 RepID=UPI0037ACAE49
MTGPLGGDEAGLGATPLWLGWLGVAPAPLTGRITAGRLASAVAEAVLCRTRAEEIAGRIAAEDGAAPVVEAVERACITP